uniref:Biogenesis of lysosome-related organelles complex 1 subunit 4 n=1 Tax=Clastoptera arizonana TaxID=38151 RepID=A0A1B6CEJ8_9HEMI
MENEDFAKNLAQSYSNYLKVDISKDVASVEEIIDDTLTRLEELESSLSIQEDDCPNVIQKLQNHKDNLMVLCEKVHKLETFVNRVEHDVNQMEAKVIAAEYDIKDNSEGKLKNLFKPLLFMKPEAMATANNTRIPPFEPPKIFETKSYFPSSNAEDKTE